jgi:peptidoglycan/LPS O-acetylase OafA/YrhL
MFVVFALFGLFVKIGKPMRGVPTLFIAVIVIAGLLGEIVARFFSDPMNRLLRRRFGDSSAKLGSILEADDKAQREGSIAV